MTRAAILVLLLAACSPAPATAEDYVARFGGLAGVYRSILGETDCGVLAGEFETATANRTTGYMTAINDRMIAIKC